MILQFILKTRFHYALLLLLPVFISACGFYLRGSQPGGVESNLSRIAITESAASDISNEVSAQLSMAGTVVSRNIDDAEFILHLASQSIDRTILSISPATGKVEEYQLTFTVLMSIRDADNNDLLSDQVIQLVRDFAFDEDSVLGSVSEQRTLEEEMTRQAATQIIRRLNAVSSN